MYKLSVILFLSLFVQSVYAHDVIHVTGSKAKAIYEALPVAEYGSLDSIEKRTDVIAISQFLEKVDSNTGLYYSYASAFDALQGCGQFTYQNKTKEDIFNSKLIYDALSEAGSKSGGGWDGQNIIFITVGATCNKFISQGEYTCDLEEQQPSAMIACLSSNPVGDTFSYISGINYGQQYQPK